MFIKAVNVKIYTVIEVITGLSILGCLVLSILGYTRVEFDITQANSISANWYTQPILEFENNCPVGFTSLIQEKWPGTVEGCDCSNVDISSIYERKINRGACSSDMLASGCKGVPSIYPKELYWGSKKLCVKRSENTYFEYSYKAAEKGKVCEIGYKICGVLDSLGNLMCEESGKQCPINKIVIQDKNLPAPKDYNYKKVSLDNNKTLYTTNEAIDLQILTEIKLSEGKVCVYPGDINVSPNLEQYILDTEYDNYKCKTKNSGTLYDSRYNFLDTTRKSQFYEENGILPFINNLPSYPLSSLNTNIDLYYRPYLGWKSSCNYDLIYSQDTVNRLDSDYNKISNFKLAILILSIILCVYYFISVIIKWSNKVKNKPILFNFIELGVFALALAIFSFANSLTSKSVRYSIAYTDDFSCGDELTNVTLMLIGKNFKSINEDYNIVAVLSFISFILYILYGFVQYFRKFCLKIKD
jgi:hypothetical protein